MLTNDRIIGDNVGAHEDLFDAFPTWARYTRIDLRSGSRLWSDTKVLATPSSNCAAHIVMAEWSLLN